MAKVRLFQRDGRPFIEAQWEDPTTGKKKTSSTKTTVRRDAERFAARLEERIVSGEMQGQPKRLNWKQAKETYETEVFPGLSASTAVWVRSMWASVEKSIDPHSMASIQEAQIASLIEHLRKLKRSGYTIRTHLAKLKQFLKWGFGRRLIQRLPTFPPGDRCLTPHRGRPITREELDRLVAAAPSVTGDALAKPWQDLLEGLWESGLRLGEALALHWTDDGRITVELAGKRPMFRIQAAGEKARTFRLLPMAPEFYRWLLKVPMADRHGFVFKIPPKRKNGGRPTLDWASKRICEIGEKAGVKVSEQGRKIKYASAHDLRRAFGLRWALRVRAPILMAMMRHSSITTTMQFYVGQNAEFAADEVWRGVANDFANDSDSSHPSAQEDHQKTA